MKKKTIFCLFGVVLMVSQVGISTAQALNEADYIGVGINYYGKNDAVCIGGSSLAGVTAIGNETAEKIFNFLTNTSIRTNGDKPLNAVQASAFIGNLMQEAGPELDPATENSIGAYGLVQWLGGRKDNLFALAAQQSKQPSDLMVQLQFLKQEIEGVESAVVLHPTFQAGTNIDEITVVIRKVYERPGEAEAMDSNRIASAKGIYAKYKDNAPVNTDSITTASQTTECAALDSGGSIFRGDLIKTALGLAWDKPVSEGTAYKKDAKPSYVAAMEKYSKIRNDNDAIDPFSDCGRFVSNVLRSSELDKNYPLVGAYTDQLPYAKSHPEMYLVIANPSFSDFKPGDIMISTSHTAIYTGADGNDMVDASLGQRVPAVGNGMSYYVTSMSDVHLVRYISKGVQQDA